MNLKTCFFHFSSLTTSFKSFVKKRYLLVSQTVHGSTEQSNFSRNFAVKEVVGPVHSARDPLTTNIPRDGALLKKKKKKRKTQTHNRQLQSKRILREGKGEDIYGNEKK